MRQACYAPRSLRPCLVSLLPRFALGSFRSWLVSLFMRLQATCTATTYCLPARMLAMRLLSDALTEIQSDAPTEILQGVPVETKPHVTYAIFCRTALRCLPRVYRVCSVTQHTRVCTDAHTRTRMRMHRPSRARACRLTSSRVHMTRSPRIYPHLSPDMCCHMCMCLQVDKPARSRLADGSGDSLVNPRYFWSCVSARAWCVCVCLRVFACLRVHLKMRLCHPNLSICRSAAAPPPFLVVPSFAGVPVMRQR